MVKTAIRASGIVKWFDEGEARTSALKDVNVEAYFGEMLYIVGPSGSGKTTLLSVLSGILRPDSFSSGRIGRKPSSRRRCTWRSSV
jgi:putative ABC transport system ATP-binding protein